MCLHVTVSVSAVCLTHALVQLKYGGEDAFFTSSVGGGAMGVADGVGGWAYAGVNPAGKKVDCQSTAKAEAILQEWPWQAPPAPFALLIQASAAAHPCPNRISLIAAVLRQLA